MRMDTPNPTFRGGKKEYDKSDKSNLEYGNQPLIFLAT
jgi:hypothetical protein